MHIAITRFSLSANTRIGWKVCLIGWFAAYFLAACGSSDSNEGAPVTVVSDGGITVASGTRPDLEPLPEVEFTGADTFSNEASVETDDGAVVSADTGAVTSTADSASDSGRTEASDSSIAYPGPVIPVDPNFQAGSLTAADYDDHLNPLLYQQYASEFLQEAGQRIDAPRLDFSQRIIIRVVDGSGNPYGGANLQVLSDGGEILSLKTPASGETAIYKNLDALPDQFDLRVNGLYGNSVQANIDLAQADNSGIIDVTIPEDLPTDSQAPIEVMFVIDTTGSMGDELDYIQTELTWIINQITDQQSGIRLGLVVYRDIGDQYVVRSYGLSDDISGMSATLNGETYDGGGDYPEAMDQALHQAVDSGWTENSRKVIFLIADAPPHGDKMRATWNAAEQARLKNIHIAPIAASGVAEDAEYIMRSMAALTNSRYLFLTDDSGFGSSHQEPNVGCYAVTPLNTLIVRVLNSLVTGVRDEPTANEIIRTVGSYNNGVCSQ